jgi:starvation-inducible DNA-binding protein
MLSTRIDLPGETREKIIRVLNQHLADTFDLYSQTKQAHWNVKGPQFFPLHELFDKLADEVADQANLLAERATSLGGVALGTTRLTASMSRLPEYPTEATMCRQHLDALAIRFASLAASTRAAIDVAGELGDAGTADLFTVISRALDKALWLLESHIQE